MEKTVTYSIVKEGLRDSTTLNENLTLEEAKLIARELSRRHGGIFKVVKTEKKHDS